MTDAEKRIKVLERLGRNQNIAAMVCYVFAIVLAITGFITNNDYARAFCIFCWLLGFVFSTLSYQNCNDRRVIILLSTVNKIVDELTADKGTPEETPEEDTKEKVIVSPEDFERFKKGEMTKEELLGIKEAVDKVVEAKMNKTDALTDKDVKTLRDLGAFCQASEIKEPLEEVVKTMR